MFIPVHLRPRCPACPMTCVLDDLPNDLCPQQCSSPTTCESFDVDVPGCMVYKASCKDLTPPLLQNSTPTYTSTVKFKMTQLNAVLSQMNSKTRRASLNATFSQLYATCLILESI